MKHAILFDFWQTLFDDSRERDTMTARKKMMHRFLAVNGYNPPDNLDDGFAAAKPWFHGIYHGEQRTPSLEERLEFVLNHYGVRITSPQMESLAHEFGELGMLLGPVPTPHIAETLELLSKRYPLGIVSDTGYTPGRVLRKHMEQHGLLRYFSAFSFSNESGRAKPHRHTFMTALDQLGVEPGAAIHCGDLLAHDVLGAKNLGITSVLYTGCWTSETDGILPDYIIADWRELPAIVDAVFA
jgi:HAD superfamily hydrolase (TIGR01549 family)